MVRIPSVKSNTNLNHSVKLLLFLIIVLSAAARFAYLAEIQNNPLPSVVSSNKVFDQYRFISTADDLLANNFLGSYPTEYSPAYSYLIAGIFKIFGRNLNYIYVLQILLGILSTYVIFKTALLLFKNVYIGIIASLTLAIYSPLIFYECTILRASIIAYINLFSLFCIIKATDNNLLKNYLISGILIGASTALRINILSLFIVIYIVLRTKSNPKILIRRVFLFILGFIVILIPLTIRNNILGQSAPISTYGPSVFWVGNSYDSTGTGYSPTPLQNQLASECEGKIIKTAKVFLREIVSHPKEYKELYLRKIKMFLNGYEIPANLSYDLFKENSRLLNICFLNFGIICPLSILGFILLFRKYNKIGLLYIFTVLLSISAIIFHIQGRYRIPAVPFFIIFSSYSFYWIFSMVKGKNMPAIIISILFIVGISFYTKTDVKIIKRYFGAKIRCIDYNNLAKAYLEKYNEEINLSIQQKKELLKEIFRNKVKAVNICPYSRLHADIRDVGILYLELEDFDEAKKVFSTILSYYPNDKAAKYYLSIIKDKTTQK